MTDPDTSSAPPYRPAPYLVSGPGAFLTAEQLVLYFEDFHASLGCVNSAPQMVFERLIGNLGGPVHAAIENARHAGASEVAGGGITCLHEPAAVALPPAAIPAPMVQPPTAIPAPMIPQPTTVPTPKVEQQVRRIQPHVIRSFGGDSSSTVRTKTFLTDGKVDLSRFAIALTSFNIPSEVQLDVSASITTPLDTGFTVSLSDPILGGASCSWIELGDHAPDMQCGVWNLFKSHNSDEMKHTIDFPMQYSETPQVLVWLTGVRMSTSLDRSLRIEFYELQNTGIKLKVISRTSSLQSIDISWLACPEPRPGLKIGRFTASQCRNNGCEGYVAFGRGWFKAPPRVAVGIMGFEIARSSHLSLSVQVVEVTSEGMKWRIDAGPDGNFTFVTASFIAIE